MIRYGIGDIRLFYENDLRFFETILKLRDVGRHLLT